MPLSTAQNTRLVFTLICASMLAAVATFLVLSNSSAPFEKHPEHIWLLLMLDLALLAGLSFIIIRQIRSFWKKGGKDAGASRLQRRIVLSFCIVTALPTIAVSIFSTLFFNLGIQAWFNDRVNTAVGESLTVAEAYLNEHKENIRVDALALADDISHFAELASVDRQAFNVAVSAQASRRRLTEVLVFQNNHIIAQGRLSFTIAFESLPQDAIARANEGEVVILSSPEGNKDDKVRAITKLEGMTDGYLMVGRLVDDKVIAHMESTQGAVNAYRTLRNQLDRLQWTFSGVFVMLTLVLFLAAVWYGMVFAARLTVPISRLSVAAERVRAGDYAGRVEVGGGEDEISVLSRTFNRMIDQLDAQRGDLIEVNRQLDERRRFTEAVLGGVSAGVVALSATKLITLYNRSAIAMLQPSDTLDGRHVNEILPGISELLAEASHGQLSQSSITLGEGQSARTLHVRVVAEYAGELLEGFIVTFDDITPLVAAQRNAAWSDVARRVAHEIKNPLTPIALSAERLKRKYLKSFEGEEADNFSKYVDTIARHVADIGRMVEEFVSFARMPGAIMRQGDLLEILKKSVFSEQVAHPSIHYRLSCKETSVPLNCDERQLSQIFTNLLKNAAEAIEGQLAQQESPSRKAEIIVHLESDGERALVEVLDSGPGFPPDKIHVMLEPYVTTRAKGTGLGLAIVKKIVEEHGGSIQLSNRDEGGARVLLSFLQQCDINTPTKG